MEPSCFSANDEVTLKNIGEWVMILLKTTLKTKDCEFDEFVTISCCIDNLQCISEDKIVKLTIFSFQCMTHSKN